MAWKRGSSQNRALLDSLLDRAARQFTAGRLRGRRAADRTLRSLLERIRALRLGSGGDRGPARICSTRSPSLQRAQLRLWWDLLAPDGYGYPWGRSLGVVSYLDTLEIAGFLAIHPEFRPAPPGPACALPTAPGAGCGATTRTTRHLLSIFARWAGQLRLHHPRPRMAADDGVPRSLRTRTSSRPRVWSAARLHERRSFPTPPMLRALSSSTRA